MTQMKWGRNKKYQKHKGRCLKSNPSGRGFVFHGFAWWSAHWKIFDETPHARLTILIHWLSVKNVKLFKILSTHHKQRKIFDYFSLSLEMALLNILWNWSPVKHRLVFINNSVVITRGGSKSHTCKSLASLNLQVSSKSQVAVIKIKQVKSGHGWGQTSHKKFVWMYSSYL